jgi:hypothetical protein
MQLLRPICDTNIFRNRFVLPLHKIKHYLGFVYIF